MNFLSDEEEHIDQVLWLSQRIELFKKRELLDIESIRRFPLKHITSIHFEYDSNTFSLILGLFVIFIGLFLLFYFQQFILLGFLLCHLEDF